MIEMPKNFMFRFAKWHIWLGWLVGVPTLMWMVTGLFMASKPIEEVRGNHLRIDKPLDPLVLPNQILSDPSYPVSEVRTFLQDGRPITLLKGIDGSTRRIDAQSGLTLPNLTENDAIRVVSSSIVGGDKIKSVKAFQSNEAPFDFRQSIPVWQITLEDGAHIYVGQETGEIEAIRTTWWRVFDFMWGLHIMDLRERDNTSHPTLILFAFLGVSGALLGNILMFRKRKTKMTRSVIVRDKSKSN